MRPPVPLKGQCTRSAYTGAGRTVTLVAILAFGALAFGFYVVAANWADYRDVLVPRPWKPRKHRESPSLKNAPWWAEGGDEE